MRACRLRRRFLAWEPRRLFSWELSRLWCSDPRAWQTCAPADCSAVLSAPACAATSTASAQCTLNKDVSRNAARLLGTSLQRLPGSLLRPLAEAVASNLRRGRVQAAKGVGKTLRSFQPTLQELSQVSNDLKTTLQTEIGLDEFQRDIDSIRNTPLLPRPAVNLDTSKMERAAVVSEDVPVAQASSSSKDVPPAAAAASIASTAKKSDEIAQDATLEQMRAESAKLAWGGVPPELSRSEAEVPVKRKALEEMSLVELEAELAKRKALIAELSRDA